MCVGEDESAAQACRLWDQVHTATSGFHLRGALRHVPCHAISKSSQCEGCNRMPPANSQHMDGADVASNQLHRYTVHQRCIRAVQKSGSLQEGVIGAPQLGDVQQHDPRVVGVRVRPELPRHGHTVREREACGVGRHIMWAQLKGMS